MLLIGGSKWEESGELQVEGHAVEAFAQVLKRLAEDARARSSNEPMPDGGMDMRSIVTIEQCEQRILLVKNVGSRRLREITSWRIRHGMDRIKVTCSA